MMKEEECLFLYAGTVFLKEKIQVKRWTDHQGKVLSSSIIHLNDAINDTKWDAFTRHISNDEIFDDDGYFSLMSSDLYWFKFVSRRPFSSQTLQEISRLLAIDVSVEDFSECDVHDHNT